METMIPPQVGMILRTMREKEKINEERRGIASILYHTCASKKHHVFHMESPMLSLSYTSGNFSLQDQMHTHLVFILSFHTLIALSAFVAWQSLLLTLISIDGHLHSPLVSRVDVRLSYFFIFFIFTPIIILYSTCSAISMACAHVLREG